MTTVETKDRNIAATGTLLIHAAVFFLIIVMMKNCTGGGGGGNDGSGNGLMSLEIAGIGNPEDGWGDTPSPSVENAPPPAVKEDVPAITDDQAEEPAPVVQITKPKVPRPPAPQPVKPVETPQPKPSDALNNAIHTLNQKGQGNTSGTGVQGNPNGQIEGKGAVNGGSGSPGSGGGTGGGAGTGNGPGSGSGSGLGSSYSLAGRQQRVRPSLDEKPKEEGKVVVFVWVDATGVVTNAEVDPQHTNTSSSTLYALAVKAAKSARFDASPGNNLQKGTITIFFELK